MAVVIRLKRGGMRHSPVYQVVAAEKSMPRDGRFLEKLGTYFPKVEDEAKGLQVNQERVAHWISKGAVPSERVKSLLKL